MEDQVRFEVLTMSPDILLKRIYKKNIIGKRKWEEGKRKSFLLKYNKFVKKRHEVIPLKDDKKIIDVSLLMLKCIHDTQIERIKEQKDELDAQEKMIRSEVKAICSLYLQKEENNNMNGVMKEYIGECTHQLAARILTSMNEQQQQQTTN